MLDALIFIDRSLFLFFNSSIANPVFDVLCPFITQRDNWIIPGILMAVVYIAREKKRALIVLGLAIVTVAISDPLCCRIIKPLIHRLRPCHPSFFYDGQHIFLSGANFLFGQKKSFSFPSAHAMNMFAQAMLLTFLYPKRTVWFFTIAAIIAFTRVYVGVHYPADIFAGAIFGMAIGAFVYLLYNYIWQKIRLKKYNLRSVQE